MIDVASDIVNTNYCVSIKIRRYFVAKVQMIKCISMYVLPVNQLAPGKYERYFTNVFIKLLLQPNFLTNFYETDVWWVPQ